jgi:hypothetical protein
MNRVNFLQQGLELNEVQASLVSELIKDIPNDKLKDFLVFRMNYVDKFKSKELITKEALFEYQKKIVESRLRTGEKVFETVEAIKAHIETFYKGQDLGNGVANFYDFVVIAINSDCELINKYTVNEHGNYKKLDSIDSARVYKWFFENQHRLGDVKIVAVYDIAPKLIEAPKEKDNVIDARVLEMISTTKQTKGGKKL